jgi:hypothetical protein
MSQPRMSLSSVLPSCTGNVRLSAEVEKYLQGHTPSSQGRVLPVLPASEGSGHPLACGYIASVSASIVT